MEMIKMTSFSYSGNVLMLILSLLLLISIGMFNEFSRVGNIVNVIISVLQTF